jgi:hypothetical protein
MPSTTAKIDRDPHVPLSWTTGAWSRNRQGNLRGGHFIPGAAIK